MKNKRFTAKILIDIGMTICLLLLMPYSLLSETAHEWIGNSGFLSGSHGGLYLSVYRG